MKIRREDEVKGGEDSDDRGEEFEWGTEENCDVGRKEDNGTRRREDIGRTLWTSTIGFGFDRSFPGFLA